MQDHCDLQNEHIADIANIKARLMTVETQVGDLSDMKENLRVLTILQQKQEERDSRLDKIMESQNEVNIETRLALQDITANLKHMNEKYDKLEDKFQDSENKSKIDTRDIYKQQVKLSLKQKLSFAGISFGALGTFAYEILKGLKIIK